MIDDTTPDTTIVQGPSLTTPTYRKLDELLELMDTPHRYACERLIADHQEALHHQPGSRKNHQAWPGGYLAHITEGMNVIVLLFALFSQLRPLPFSLSSALFVFFLHDLEKLSKYKSDGHGGYEVVPELATKPQERARRGYLLEYHQVFLTPEERIAFKYVEGEGSDYTPDGVRMNPLGALCHIADVTSARLWPQHPIAHDPWRGSEAYANPLK